MFARCSDSGHATVKCAMGMVCTHSLHTSAMAIGTVDCVLGGRKAAHWGNKRADRSNFGIF